MARFTLTIGDTLNKFCETEAKRLGIAKNAYIATCIDKCKEMKEKEANKCDTK